MRTRTHIASGPLGVLLFAGAAACGMIACAGDDSGGPSGAVNVTTTEPDRTCSWSPPVTVDDIVVQLGAYNLGDNIDGFVFGPLVVVYDDGRFAAQLTTEVGLVEGYACGRLTPSELDALVDAAPTEPSGPIDPVEDGTPTLLVVDDRHWGLSDAGREPFAGFIGRVDDLVRAVGREWPPSRFVTVAEVYSVQREPGERAGVAAPLFPHLDGLDAPDADMACDAIVDASYTQPPPGRSPRRNGDGPRLPAGRPPERPERAAAGGGVGQSSRFQSSR